MEVEAGVDMVRGLSKGVFGGEWLPIVRRQSACVK